MTNQSQVSVSFDLASFFSNLDIETVPSHVVDKAKAVLLHGLLIGLASVQDSDVAIARELVLDEEYSPNGARLVGFGQRVTRQGAAFVASTLFHSRGQDDSYRMLTHPGPAILSTALAMADGNNISGKTLLAAILAGYEIQCRIARDTVPSVQNQGFRASSLFAIFGATAVTARLLNLSAEEFGHALALATSVAAGSVEPSRTGTREMTFQEPIVVRSGISAAQLAARGVTGGPTPIDGRAGFLNTFVGSVEGQLDGSFHGETSFDPRSISADLGSRWEILDVTMKIYSTAGFNQPVIEAVTRLAQEHDLTVDNVESMRIEMNLWETVYPSPKFATQSGGSAYGGRTATLAARTLAGKGMSSTGERASYGRGDPTELPEAVAALAQRTEVVAADVRQYSPRITVVRTDGSVVSTEMTGDEFKWDFATERERIRAVYPALAFSEEQADELVDLISRLETVENVDRLIDLTLP